MIVMLLCYTLSRWLVGDEDESEFATARLLYFINKIDLLNLSNDNR